MGINAFTVEWLLRLKNEGLFDEKKNIAEFGPQDFCYCEKYMKAVASSLFPEPALAERFYRRIFPEDRQGCAEDAQRYFYSVLGLEEYSGFDYYDTRAEYKFDLNYPVNMRDRFDVITNFGTAEHVSNIGAIFLSTHNLLNVGGLSLNILPAFGDINHGFFNIHPIFFKAMAHYNDYEIIEHIHVDHAEGRAFRREACPTDPSPFEDFLEVTYDDGFPRRVEERFARNMEWERKRRAETGEFSHVYDYSYVVLRKRSNARFTWPSQTIPLD